MEVGLQVKTAQIWRRKGDSVDRLEGADLVEDTKIVKAGQRVRRATIQTLVNIIRLWRIQLRKNHLIEEQEMHN